MTAGLKGFKHAHKHKQYRLFFKWLRYQWIVDLKCICRAVIASPFWIIGVPFVAIGGLFVWCGEWTLTFAPRSRFLKIKESEEQRRAVVWEFRDRIK